VPATDPMLRKPRPRVSRTDGGTRVPTARTRLRGPHATPRLAMASAAGQQRDVRTSTPRSGRAVHSRPAGHCNASSGVAISDGEGSGPSRRGEAEAQAPCTAQGRSARSGDPPPPAITAALGGFGRAGAWEMPCSACSSFTASAAGPPTLAALALPGRRAPCPLPMNCWSQRRLRRVVLRPAATAAGRARRSRRRHERPAERLRHSRRCRG
jgi:hypothetical protein